MLAARLLSVLGSGGGRVRLRYYRTVQNRAVVKPTDSDVMNDEGLERRRHENNQINTTTNWIQVLLKLDIALASLDFSLVLAL